jgi:transglutaminase-like putative cysteine protease
MAMIRRARAWAVAAPVIPPLPDLVRAVVDLWAEQISELSTRFAWVQVFDPDHGWFGVDPTHNKWVEDRYVRLGIGRDYRDVPPNRVCALDLPAIEQLEDALPGDGFDARVFAWGAAGGAEAPA